MKYIVLLVIFLFTWGAICPNACSGHGTCDSDGKCSCFKQKGLGLNSDSNSEGYTGLDCSLRTCPKANQFSPQIFLVNTRGEDTPVDGGGSGGNGGGRLLDDEEFENENITKIITINEIDEFNTYKLGGSLICYKDDKKKTVVGYVDVLAYANKTMISVESWLDDNYNMSNSHCIVKYVRKDLSLFSPINTTREWNSQEYSTLFNRYYGYNDSEYNVTLACVVSIENGNDQYNEVVEYKAKMNIEDERIDFEIQVEYQPEGNCFLLGGYNNVNIALESSELFENLLSKVDGRYYYGIKMEQDAVIDEISSDAFEADDNGISSQLNLPLTAFEKLSDDDQSTMLLSLTPGNVITIIGYPPQNEFGSIVKYTVTIVSVKKISGRERERILADNHYEIIFTPQIPVLYGYSYSLSTRTTNGGAVSVHQQVECSGAGVCNRITGKCECYSGYDGAACQRLLICPNNCNNNGKCVEYTKTLGDDRFTLESMASYGFGTDERIIKNSNEKRAKFFGCLCDPGHRGADCSLNECPSTKDPQGASNIAGAEYRDCSGRGTCDYNTGICKCHDGFSGTACENIASLQ